MNKTLTRPLLLTTLLVGMGSISTGCHSAGTHMHSDVPENHAAVHKSKVPVNGQIEPGELAATKPMPADGEKQLEREGGGLVIATNLREACNIARDKALFDYDSAELREGAEDMLEQLASCFDEGPMRYQGLKITGHADPRGPADYNRELGRERAEAVADFLVEEGVEDHRLEVVSRGEAKASDEPEDWQQDRKVVLELSS